MVQGKIRDARAELQKLSFTAISEGSPIHNQKYPITNLCMLFILQVFSMNFEQFFFCHTDIKMDELCLMGLSPIGPRHVTSKIDRKKASTVPSHFPAPISPTNQISDKTIP